MAPQPACVTGPMHGVPWATTNAYVAPELALDADAVGRYARPSPYEKAGDYLQQLLLVDGASSELEVYNNMLGYRGRGLQCLDVLRRSVDY